MRAVACVSGTHCNIRNGPSVNIVDLLALQRNVIPKEGKKLDI